MYTSLLLVALLAVAIGAIMAAGKGEHYHRCHGCSRLVPDEESVVGYCEDCYPG